ncbi:MAG: cytochrome c [Caldimonas sp.]|nr:cytochrome c [Pseudomonadota bacterium]
MTRNLRLATGAAVLVFATAFAVAAPKSITLPPDVAVLRPSPLPGYAKAQTDCLTCHSAEYMLMQPPNAGRPYWDAMAKRMKVVFKAPFDEADIPAIVDYLSATYGNQKP